MSDSILPAVRLDNLAALGISALGWTPSGDHISTDQWTGVADFAVMMGRSSMFMLGDLWIYAQSRGAEYEHLCQQWMTENGYAEQTGYNAAVIARLFPKHMRRLDGVCSFKHHEAVRNLARENMAEAQKLLEQAQVEGWRSEDLQKEANARVQTPLRARRKKKPHEDAPDWRDGLLAEAEGLIELLGRYEPDRSGAADWLARYRAQRDFVKANG